MTDAEIRIVIADLQGIPVNVCKCGDTIEAHTHSNYEHGFCPMVEESEVPDYPNDLNAMHEVFLHMSPQEKFEYTRQLYIVTGTPLDGSACAPANASAKKRAVAYLRTVGKLKD